MPYNLGMTEITLALPYALPPSEMATDLLRALKMPALAALLSRHSYLQYNHYDNDSRVLPHEAWLAHTLGLASAPNQPDTGAPLATACMHGCGLQAEAAQGHWFIVQPAHIQLSRTHTLLSDMRALQLTEEESRGLYDVARPYFEELGKPLLYGAPGPASPPAPARCAPPRCCARAASTRYWPACTPRAACRRARTGQRAAGADLPRACCTSTPPPCTWPTRSRPARR
jgi:hypothetical protein